jgi:hypothetical protein
MQCCLRCSQTCEYAPTCYARCVAYRCAAPVHIARLEPEDLGIPTPLKLYTGAETASLTGHDRNKVGSICVRFQGDIGTQHALESALRSLSNPPYSVVHCEVYRLPALAETATADLSCFNIISIELARCISASLPAFHSSNTAHAEAAAQYLCTTVNNDPVAAGPYPTIADATSTESSMIQNAGQYGGPVYRSSL